MVCEYCKGINSHDCRCPSCESPKSNHNCYECGENILFGEEYIVNDNGDYAHLECVDYVRDLARFLGYEIKEMKNEND